MISLSFTFFTCHRHHPGLHSHSSRLQHGCAPRVCSHTHSSTSSPPPPPPSSPWLLASSCQQPKGSKDKRTLLSAISYNSLFHMKQRCFINLYDQFCARSFPYIPFTIKEINYNKNIVFTYWIFFLYILLYQFVISKHPYSSQNL